MVNLPLKTPIIQDELYGSREIRFKDRTDSQFAQLMRLCVDFDFSVLQIQRKTYSHLTRKFVPMAPDFVLATKTPGDPQWYAVTPELASLKALDDYARAHQVDILHDHLFGAEDESLNKFLAEGF
jgi:hypothetical protein